MLKEAQSPVWRHFASNLRLLRTALPIMCSLVIPPYSFSKGWPLGVWALQFPFPVKIQEVSCVAESQRFGYLEHAGLLLLWLLTEGTSTFYVQAWDSWLLGGCDENFTSVKCQKRVGLGAWAELGWNFGSATYISAPLVKLQHCSEPMLPYL